MNKGLNLLGLARKAGKVVLGTDSVIKVLQIGQIKLILVANDASNSTYDKLDKKAYFYQVPLINNYSTVELSKAMGIGQIKVIGITDSGFALALQKEIERGDF